MIRRLVLFFKLQNLFSKKVLHVCEHGEKSFSKHQQGNLIHNFKKHNVYWISVGIYAPINNTVDNLFYGMWIVFTLGFPKTKTYPQKLKTTLMLMRLHWLKKYFHNFITTKKLNFPQLSPQYFVATQPSPLITIKKLHTTYNAISTAYYFFLQNCSR